MTATRDGKDDISSTSSSVAITIAIPAVANLLPSAPTLLAVADEVFE
jgi:hypothetical protein